MRPHTIGIGTLLSLEQLRPGTPLRRRGRRRPAVAPREQPDGGGWRRVRGWGIVRARQQGASPATNLYGAAGVMPVPRQQLCSGSGMRKTRMGGGSLQESVDIYIFARSKLWVGGQGGDGVCKDDASSDCGRVKCKRGKLGYKSQLTRRSHCGLHTALCGPL